MGLAFSCDVLYNMNLVKFVLYSTIVLVFFIFTEY